MGLLIWVLPLFRDFVDSASMASITFSVITVVLIPLTFVLGVLGLVFRKVALRKKTEGEPAKALMYMRWMRLIGIYDVTLPLTFVVIVFLLTLFLAFSVPI